MKAEYIESIMKIAPQIAAYKDTCDNKLDMLVKKTRSYTFWDGVSRILEIHNEFYILLELENIMKAIFEKFDDDEKQLYVDKYVYAKKLVAKEMTTTELRRYFRAVEKLIKHAVEISDKKGYNDLFYKAKLIDYGPLKVASKEIAAQRNKHKGVKNEQKC